jgi:hypothetical protein
MGRTQCNENINRIVASKNPKKLFYSGSESTAFRVAAVVGHKDTGHIPIQEVRKITYERERIYFQHRK